MQTNVIFPLLGIKEDELFSAKDFGKSSQISKIRTYST